MLARVEVGDRTTSVLGAFGLLVCQSSKEMISMVGGARLLIFLAAFKLFMA